MTIPQRLFSPLYYYTAKPVPSSLGDTRSTTLPTTTSILACSIDGSQHRLFELQKLDRRLCEDRKNFFEHLTPASLTKSTFRIVVTQSSFVLSSYANDQLQQDLARDKLIAEGKITQEEADDEAEEWETREWKARWESFPSKLTEALVKYHLIVLVMRAYEHVAEKIVDKIKLDSLTLDTFKYAKLLNAKEENRAEVGKQMFTVCGKANLISFLADYSVHQLIIAYGYYVYIQESRKRRRNKEDGQQNKKNDDNKKNKEEKDRPPIVKQSATLVMSRSLGLLFTAAGGAMGSMMYPGWGTLVGSNLGDSLGGIVAESTL